MRDVFGTSVQKVARQIGRVGRSVNELLNLSRATVDDTGKVTPIRQTIEEFLAPKELPLPAGVAQWGALRKMIQAIGDRVTKMDNPHRQGLAIQLIDDVVDRKNWFEAEAAARRKQLREELAGGLITPKEHADLTDDTFTYQGRNVAALYLATHEALDHLESQAYPDVPNSISGEIKERVRVGIQRMHDEALTKRDMDMFLDPDDKTKVIFKRTDPEELEVLEAARDTLYRDSRTAQRGYLSDTLERIDELMGAPDETTRGMLNDVTEGWRQRVGELGQFARPARERLGVLSRDSTDVLGDQMSELEDATRRWTLTRERVKSNALPILVQHYRDAGQTVKQATESAASHMTSSKALLAKLDELEQARTLPGPWEEMARVKRDLAKYGGLDILRTGDNPALKKAGAESVGDSFDLTCRVGPKYANSQGVQRRRRGWAPYTAIIWKDLALLSLRSTWPTSSGAPSGQWMTWTVAGMKTLARTSWTFIGT